MRKYTIKKLIDGDRIGAQFAGKTLVAVPERSVKRWNGLLVTFGKDSMPVLPSDKPISGRRQDDKFGRESFLLLYFEWQPHGKKSEIEKEFGDSAFSVFQHPLINGGKPCKVLKELLPEWEKLAREKESLTQPV